MKPLIFIPSPRNLPKFSECMAKVKKYDKLWVKYWEQTQAYMIARDWFLNEDYTHIVIFPDDMIGFEHQIDQLLGYNLPVVSGWCNEDGVRETSQISAYLPPDPPTIGQHDEFKFYKIPWLEHLGKNLTDPLIEVLFSGFALSVIKRDIMEAIPFRTSAGCCVDSCFSLDLYKSKIIQYVDVTTRTCHLKTEDSQEWYSNLLVGKEEPCVRLEKA